MDAISAFFAQATEVVLMIAKSTPALVVVVELILRVVPTEKPLSIVRGIAATFTSLGKFSTEVANFLDGILPQKVATPPQE